MASNARVPAGRIIDSDMIDCVINELNATRFKNCLLIDRERDLWTIRCPSADPARPLWSRCCWVQGRDTFYMSHGGGGSDFAWWVDFSITNVIAVVYDRVIMDDADDVHEQGNPNYHPTFRSFVEHMEFRVAESRLRQMACCQA